MTQTAFFYFYVHYHDWKIPGVNVAYLTRVYPKSKSAGPLKNTQQQLHQSLVRVRSIPTVKVLRIIRNNVYL